MKKRSAWPWSGQERLRVGRAPPGTPPKPARKTGQQSYGDIENLFKKLIEAVKLVPGYKPDVSSNIELSQLEQLLTDFGQANKNAATNEAVLDAAQRARKAIYDGKPSLITKMKAIKKAVGGQYSRQSPEFAAMKGIAL